MSLLLLTRINFRKESLRTLHVEPPLIPTIRQSIAVILYIPVWQSSHPVDHRLSVFSVVGHFY